MVICIDRFLSDQYLSGYRLLIEDLMEELARCHPTHQFIWLTTAPQAAGASLTSNITIYPVNSWVLRWLGKKAWFKTGLPRLLRKLQAGVFLSTGNLPVPATPVPCFLFLPAGTFCSGAEISSRHAARLLISASRRLQTMVVFSHHDEKCIRETCQAAAARTVYLKLAAIHPISSLSIEEREKVKDGFAAGLEYFVFAGDLREEHMLTVLLKAFSQFKKWQRSNMQLVIAGSTTARTDAWLSTIPSYKWRKDVHVLQDPPKEELLTVIAGAYAFVYPARHEPIPVTPLYALHAGVPVIASRIPVIEEVMGQAALYASVNDENGFAAAMQALYKDEPLRDSLIQKAAQHLKETATGMAEDCWHILETGLHRESV